MDSRDNTPLEEYHFERRSSSGAASRGSSSGARRSTSHSSSSRSTASRSGVASAGAPRRKLTKSQIAARKRRKKILRIRRKLHRYGSLTVIVAVLLYIALLLINKNSITLDGVTDGQTIVLQYGQDSLPDITATFKGTLFNRKGVDVEVSQEGEVDLTKLGTYQVTYTASHKSKKASASVTIQVVDTQEPRIELVSNDDYYTGVGMDYVEEGFTATDNYDGDLTDKVQRTEGEGTVTYTVTDSNGNTATATRTIEYTDKIVYLTFDDGPGKYTEELLDKLAEYNVKATFFVTNQFPDYIDSIKREAEEGHTVAIHSYEHDFATCYSSAEAFWQDIGQMGSLINELTGQTPTLFRFPGGSGNSASKKYCTGVMTQLTSECESKGYQYVDWNVNSGDADGITDPNEIANNVIEGLSDHSISIVLQHDIKPASIEAMDKILTWGQENGYTFLPLTESSWIYHGSTIRN